MSLESFFGSYLNDDYDVVDGSPEDCVRAFAQNQPIAEVSAARAELLALLRETDGDDAALERAVSALGAGFLPPSNVDLRALLTFAASTWTESTAHVALG